MTYRPEIDGLRALAVMAVIAAHAGFNAFAGGFVGVDIFFVLSGYLIGTIIIRELEDGTFTFRRFYARRARRILPALFVVLTATWIPAWFLMTHSEILDFAPSVLASLLFISNVYFWDLTGYFSPGAETLPLLHTWSLSIEEQYYLLFPLIGFVTYKFLGKTGFFAVVLLLAALSLTLAEWGAANKPSVNYFFTFSRVWEILAGTLCVWIERQRKPRGNDVLAMAGLGAIAASILLYSAATPFPSLYATVPVAGTMAVLLFARQGTQSARLLSLKACSVIGLISYSAYLWHQPVFAFARLADLSATHSWIAAPLIALILGLAWTTCRFVEVPFRSGRTGIKSNLSAGLIATAAFAILASASIAVYSTDASLLRYSANDRPLFEVTRRDARSYMRHRGDAFLNRPFANDGRRKIFIVGDSFSQDFINLLAENGHLKDLDISIHLISSECGNIFLTDKMDFPPVALPPKCNDISRYETADIQNRLASADAVLLISRWHDKFVKYLPESLSQINAVANGPVLTLGTKGFGPGDPSLYREIPAEDRATFLAEIGSETQQVNERLSAMNLPGYIDVQRALCGSSLKCAIITPSGHLVSLDRSHLTQEGARAFGPRFFENAPKLRAALGISP